MTLKVAAKPSSAARGKSESGDGLNVRGYHSSDCGSTVLCLCAWCLCAQSSALPAQPPELPQARPLVRASQPGAAAVHRASSETCIAPADARDHHDSLQRRKADSADSPPNGPG